MADVAADFNDAFEVLSKLQTLDRRWTKAPAKNLLVDTAGERAILCSAKVFDKVCPAIPPSFQPLTDRIRGPKIQIAV